MYSLPKKAGSIPGSISVPAEGDLKPLGLTALLYPTLPLLGLSPSSPAHPGSSWKGSHRPMPSIYFTPKTTISASPQAPYPGTSLWTCCLHSCP